MRNSLLIVLSMLLLDSCKSNKIPSGILSKDKMQAVLWDMMRADQFLTDFVFSKDSSVNHDTASINLYSEILASHNLSKDEFKKSFDYYNLHPALLKAVMDSVAAMNVVTNPPAPVKKDTSKRRLRIR